LRQSLILGIALLGHDLSMTVIGPDGQVLTLAEEERYSGIKGGRFVFHPDLVQQILAGCGARCEDVSVLALAGRTEAWRPRNQVHLPFNQRARRQHGARWVRILGRCLPNLKKVMRVRHHAAHCASTFLASGWDQAAILTADGFGDGEVTTISLGKGGRIQKLAAEPFPHSLPYLYRAFATWLGLRGREREGKLMALASYGRPIHIELLRRVLTGASGGSFRVSNIFLTRKCRTEPWAEVLAELLGPSHTPGISFCSRDCDLAASMQRLLEEEIIALARRARSATGLNRCCVAGGVFTNSAANGRLIAEGVFREIFIPPVVGDSGISLGAALLAARRYGHPQWTLPHAYLGDDLDVGRLPELATRFNLRWGRLKDPAAWAARCLADGRILGWCQGRAEVGPRALGNRSLFGDPRHQLTSRRLTRIKRREDWRPFAPVILEEDASYWFGRPLRSPFMSAVYPMAKRLESASHFDGTARIQTVRAAENQMLADLLRHFRDITGVGMLINTSLNVQGKPIARSVSDCLEFLLTTDVDGLVIGPYWVERSSDSAVRAPEQMSLPCLPPKFLLAVSERSGAPAELLAALRERASSEFCLPARAVVSLEDDLLAACPPGIGGNLVVLLPWYLDVSEEMPRLGAQILEAELRFVEVWVIDSAGRSGRAREVFGGLSPAALRRRPFTDVEQHFLNRERWGWDDA
jgi:carbamoyltransferase